MRRVTVVLAGLVLMLGIRAAAAPNLLKDEVITREQRVIGLATVYSNVKQHSAYLDRFGPQKWDKAFVEYLPLVEKKQSLCSYYQVLQRFAALIGDGHTDVSFPPEVYKDTLDVLPIRLDIVENKWVVVQRFPTDQVLKEDVPPGSILESIEGQDPSNYFEKFYPYISAGRERVRRTKLNTSAFYPKDSKVKLTLRYPDGSTHEREIKANRSTMNMTEFAKGDYTQRWHGGVGFWSSEPEPGILYLCFRRCDSDSEKELCKLLESKSSNWPKGVILDLRDNPGGNSPMSCLRHLISKPAPDYNMSSRWSISYMDAQMQGMKPTDAASKLKNWGFSKEFTPGWYTVDSPSDTTSPAKIHYDGPLAVLIGPVTGSAAEDLVARLKQAGRGTFIGENTAGTTGQPLPYSLPGGGSGRVCTTKCSYADGKEMTAVGCEPDITVLPSIKGIAERRDEVLEAALKYLRSM